MDGCEAMRLALKIEQMKRPGMTTFASDEAAMPVFMDTLLRLKQDGHAVHADVTFDAKHSEFDTRVFHYLTCVACLGCVGCERAKEIQR